MQALLLGTSAAWPIPRPGCACAQCEEARGEPALRRMRSCLRLAVGDEVAFVDVGPDVLHQLERAGLDARADRAIVTHTHADHVLGLDDLVRVEGRADPLAVHAAPWHRRRLQSMFAGLVRPDDERIVFRPWSAGERIELGEVVLEGFETGHRVAFPTTGVLFELADGRRIAYATDLGRIPETTAERLAGVDLFVGDGTYLGGPGYGHPGTDAVIRTARAVGARRTALSHVGHLGLADARVRKRLPDDVLVLRDGQDLFAV